MNLVPLTSCWRWPRCCSPPRHRPGRRRWSACAAAGTLRVCIWPDYYGITYRNPRSQQLSGLDIDLSSRAGARELGGGAGSTSSPRSRNWWATSTAAAATWPCSPSACWPAARSSWPSPSPTCRATSTASPPAPAARCGSGATSTSPACVVAVQAGTFMEPVMRDALKQARMVVISPPATREQELEAGRVDVFMTDYPYSRRLLDNADWARLVAPQRPFFVLPYAYAVKQRRCALAGAAGRVRRRHQARRPPARRGAPPRAGRYRLGALDP